MKFNRNHKKNFMIGLAICGIGLLGFFGNQRDRVEHLYRDIVNEKTDLYVSSEDGTEELIQVKIPSRELKDSEKEALVQRAYKEIMSYMIGDNPSLQEVTKPLELPYEWNISGICMEVTWDIPKTAPISSTGRIKDITEDMETTIKMSIGLDEVYHAWDIVIGLKAEDQYNIETSIQEYINGQTENQIMLPKELNGKQVSFYRTKRPNVIPYLLPGVVFVLYVFAREHEQKKEQRKERISSLEKAYPEFVMKVNLLYFAGLSMQNIWKKLGAENPHQTHLGKEIDKVNQMITNGIPETAVYWEFGESCGLQGYRRLASVMEQAVQKGSSGVNRLLDDMAREALLEQKHLVKQEGETINTKLLGPMMMLLLVIIVMVMAPVVMSLTLEV